MPATRGFTLIVLSYDRPRSLRTLLGALAQQQLDGLSMELILCNNAAGVHLAASPWTATGRVLRNFPDLKIFNSSHNWLCRIRYNLAALAAHETIVFIDDDVVIHDPGFLRYMYDAFSNVRPIDVLACWTALWTEWDERCLKKVRMNFNHPEPDVITECDYAGPGLCIFDRRILIDSGLLALPAEFHRSDSTWFPWLTTMKLGTRKYYLPSYGRVSFHEQYARHELTTSPGFRPDMYAAYKRLWKQGYVPVLERRRSEPGFEQSPELRAARTLRVESDDW
jgi:hypothetical protein